MADITLLPCPFCGGEADTIETPWVGQSRIACEDCNLSTENMDDAEVVIFWNTRAAPPAMDREAVEKVRAFLEERIANYSGLRDQAVDAGTDENGYALATEALERTLDALSTLSADAIRQGEVHKAAREAIILIDEINERGESRRFNGIGQALHSKLCTIRATLAIAFARERQDATPASHSSDGGKA